MSQKYSIEDYDDDKETNSDDTASDKGKGQELIQGQCFEFGQSHSIDFVMVDGSRQSFAYSYLVTFRLDIEDEQQKLSLFYTTHWVYIRGYCLDLLYEAIREKNLICIKQVDQRYTRLDTEAGNEPLVTVIDIEWK